MTKNYDDFRAGMLRAAEMCRNEFKRAPEAAKGHDCVYMSGYEDACDHLSAAIAQAAVIDSVRIAGARPDWQYHISLLLPDGIEDETLLRIYQVVEHELRAPPERTQVAGERLDAMWEALKAECCKNPVEAKTIVFLGEDKFKKALAHFAAAPADDDAESSSAVELRSACCGAPTRTATTDYNVCTACNEACETTPATTKGEPLMGVVKES